MNRVAQRNGIRRDRRESFGLAPEDLRTLRALKTPAQIQKFIGALPYQHGNTAWSPQRALREQKGLRRSEGEARSQASCSRRDPIRAASWRRLSSFSRAAASCMPPTGQGMVTTGTPARLNGVV